MSRHDFRIGLLATVLLAAATGASTAAESRDPVPSLAAIDTALGAHASALTYWVGRPDGWHVVTTVDTGLGESGPHSVVRFATVMQPDQQAVISVPGGPGLAAAALRISRSGDKLSVTPIVDGGSGDHGTDRAVAGSQ